MQFNPTNYPLVTPVAADTVLLRRASNGAIRSALVSSLQSAGTDAVRYVDDIDALKALTVDGLADNASVQVSGYYTPGDGGGGEFVYDEDAVTADNGGTVIAPLSGGGRWLRVWSGPLNVRWFGAKGDGTTDDSGAAQAAVNVADAAKGGTVYFPVPGRYVIDDEVVIDSDYPINLLSEMYGYVNPSARVPVVTPIPSCILPGPNLSASMFKYTGSLGAGGTVRGLSFFDDTTATVSGQGTRAITAALELDVFNLSSVVECQFQHILGSAIKVKAATMVNLSSCIIRYCGATGKPALWFSGTGTDIAQSFNVNDLRCEVCYTEPYVLIAPDNATMKFRGCGFEADTAIAGSNNPFMSMDGDRIFVSDCHFNRNSDTLVELTSNSSFITLGHCSFRCDGTPASLTIAGVDHTVDACWFNSAKTGDEIYSTGSRVLIDGCHLTSGGGITGADSTLTVKGCFLTNLATTNDYWIEVVRGSLVQGCQLRGTNAGTAGGIHADGLYIGVVGNYVANMAGFGIRIEDPQAVVVANICRDNTAGDHSYASVLNGSGFNYFLDDTPEDARFADLITSQNRIATPSASQALAAGTALLANSKNVMFTCTGAVASTAAPFIANGSDGQELMVINVGSGTLTISDQGTLAGSNLRLTANTIDIAPRQSLKFMYSSTIGDWVQVGDLVAVL